MRKKSNAYFTLGVTPPSSTSTSHSTASSSSGSSSSSSNSSSTSSSSNSSSSSSSNSSSSSKSSSSSSFQKSCITNTPDSSFSSSSTSFSSILKKGQSIKSRSSKSTRQLFGDFRENLPPLKEWSPVQISKAKAKGRPLMSVTLPRRRVLRPQFRVFEDESKDDGDQKRSDMITIHDLECLFTKKKDSSLQSEDSEYQEHACVSVQAEKEFKGHCNGDLGTRNWSPSVPSGPGVFSSTPIRL